MAHSLRVRLLGALVLVLVVAVGALALLVYRSATSEFQQYISQTRTLNLERLVGTLREEYGRSGSWRGAQALIEPLGRVVGSRIILLDAHQQVVADSERELLGAALAIPAGPVAPAVPQMLIADDSGYVIGFLMVLPAPSPPEENFLDALNRSLLLAVIIAAGAALLLTLFLSRRILGPIEALTSAARKMEKGDLGQRVPVKTRDEIGTLAGAFNNMAETLARQEELRRNMVNDVAHELRTPLANLRGYLEALQDGVIQPDPALLVSLHEETLLLNRLVEDMQELALAEARQLRLVRHPAAPAAMIAGVAQAFQPLAAEKGIELSVELPPLLPRVLVDPARVGQVLRNLLNNAMTHTPAGGRITIGATSRGSVVEITVRDSGSGIDPAHLPHIFDRFWRADPSRARSTGGAGLGLAIVKQLVELHGGTVSAESTPGEGATFSFTLPSFRPRRRIPIARPGEETAAKEPAAAIPGSG